jgi:hypothetical protein
MTTRSPVAPPAMPAEWRRLQQSDRCQQMDLFDGVTPAQLPVVEYVPWDVHRANTERLQNPIQYTYRKGDKYPDDRELRISLSAFGIGHFVLNDGSRLDFRPNPQVGFDFKSAFADGTITRLLLAQDHDVNFLRAELDNLRIAPVEH